MATKNRCTPYLLFVVIVAAFSGFLYGYHTGVIAGALPFLTASFHLSSLEQGVVVSILLLGGVFGALVAGTLADRIGRKSTIGLTMALFAMGAVLSALSNAYATVLIGRLLSGIGVGIVSVAAPIYLAEVSLPKYRGSFVSLFQLAIAAGMLCSFAVSSLFAPSGNWRWMFAIGCFPALFQLLGVFFIPETPPWLLNQGLEEDALQTLQKLGKDHCLSHAKNAAAAHKDVHWKALLSPRFRFILAIGLTLSALQQITGVNTVFYYAPKIFETAGFPSSNAAISATLGIGVINLVTTALSVWLLDRIGRRPLLLIGTAGMTLSLAMLSYAFFVASSSISAISMISLMFYAASFAMGLGPVTWVVLSEIYPMQIRAKAMTMAIFINWVCNYLVCLTFPNLIHLLGGSGTFLLYALISALGFFFMYRFILETKSKSLDEIEKILSKRSL